MTEPSPPDDGLTEAQRVLFGLFVQWFSSHAGHRSVVDALGWSVADAEARYRGDAAFSSDELAAVATTVAALRGRTPAEAEADAKFLDDVRARLVRGEEDIAGWIRGKVCAPAGAPSNPPELEAPASAAAEPPPEHAGWDRVADVMLDPELSKVVLPAAVFGLVVGIPLLPHVKPFAEETSLSMTWLLIFGAGLWAVLNVLGIDRLMRWVIRHGLRRLPPIKAAYEELDARLASSLRTSARRDDLYRYATAVLPDARQRENLKVRLAKADTCDRLAVWMVLAAPLAVLALTDATWPQLVYPAVLVFVSATLVPASIDHVRRAFP